MRISYWSSIRVLFRSIMIFANMYWALIGEATIDTLLMTRFSFLFTILIGLPLGIVLFLTSKNQMMENGPVYQVLSFVVNVLRSVPFLILLIVMIPLTRVLAGTSLGVQGAVPPLEIGRASCRKECVSTCSSRWSPYI